MRTVALHDAALSRPVSKFAELAAPWRLPLHAWSARRRSAVAALVAVTVFASGAIAWRACDAGGRDASRAALDRATRTLAEARRDVDTLPKLRDAFHSAFAQTRARAKPTGAAETVQLIARLAARSGLVLLSMEPAAVAGTGDEAMQPMRIVARADFRQLMAFLRGLTRLPMLVVPDDVLLKHNGDTLGVSATLRVFGALAPPDAAPSEASNDEAATASGMSDDEFIVDDPFAASTSSAVANGTDVATHLVGVLIDRVKGVALFEHAQSVEEIARGQWLGDERLVRVGDADVSLEANGSVRTLGFAKAAT